VPEIEQMKADAAAGKQHPMELKKALARRIVQDFHGEQAAKTADENWAKQFQKDEVPANAPVVVVPYSALKVNPQEVISPEHHFVVVDANVLSALKGDEIGWIRLDRLLHEVKLTVSRTEAARKIKEKAVRINNRAVPSTATNAIVQLPSEIAVALGRKLCRAQITKQ
jgi:tyrosyl-tRNA synthetase